MGGGAGIPACIAGGITACLAAGGVLSQHALQQGVPGPGGFVPRGCLLGGLLPGGAWWAPTPDGYCCRWYASYWNAFLLDKVINK